MPTVRSSSLFGPQDEVEADEEEDGWRQRNFFTDVDPFVSVG